MQRLRSTEVVPNVILRRLIRDWRASNANFGGDHVGMTITRHAEVREVKNMLRQLKEANREDSSRIIKELNSVIRKSETNRSVFSKAGAVPTLCKFLFAPSNMSRNLEACEKALALLTLLPLDKLKSETTIGRAQLTAISWFLCKGRLNARVNAAVLLESLTKNDDEMKLSVGATAGVLEGLVQLLREDSCPQAIYAGLKASLSVMGLGRNLIKVVEAGMVFSVMEILSVSGRGYLCSALTLLERLCSCVGGRTAISAHALALPVLARIINLRSSTVATEKAISCLHILCQDGPTAPECRHQIAIQPGLLTQLLHVSESGAIDVVTKRQATQLFRQLQYRLKNCPN